MLDVTGPFGFNEVSESVALDLASTLRGHELRTWNEIFGADTTRNHSNLVEKFSGEARKRLRQLERDDFDVLHSIRLSGKGRLYGVWRQGVFYVFWWDRNHQVYPSQMKHT